MRTFDELKIYRVLIRVKRAVQQANKGAFEDFPLIGQQVRQSVVGVWLGCRAREVLIVVHGATDSSVRRRGTSMVEYASIQGKV